MKSTHSRRTLLQVLQKCPVRATSEMLLELHNPHPALCSFIGNRYEPTSFAPLDSHLRHHGHSCAAAHHG
jgi:hypothetical protein